jgi:hypothetical protein
MGQACVTSTAHRRAVGAALAAERQASDERRARAMEQWTVDPMSRQRTAMQIAAFLLDEAGERSLAEYLLCARPEHAMTVAAGFAAHALRRCLPAAWDALASTGSMDIDAATDMFLTPGYLDWTPNPEWLMP